MRAKPIMAGVRRIAPKLAIGGPQISPELSPYPLFATPIGGRWKSQRTSSLALRIGVF